MLGPKLIGSALAHFQITAKLGEGGMGEVYRAEDTKLGRNVAIKVLPEAFVADPERLARFEREARVLAQLNHPNIAAIHGIEVSGATHALVMELAEGPTLAERVSHGALGLEESLSVGLQIAAALEEAHEKGIVHRDLKPANIKLTADGEVKVLDFGLAKALEPVGGSSIQSELTNSPTLTFGATAQGAILGTAAYMAPEQAAGKAVDRRADIWAFGVVLWELLTGRRLFEGETVTHVLAAVMKDEISLAALPASTPSAIRTLLARCLRRKPKERLQAIGDARLVIEDLLVGRIDDLETVSAPELAGGSRGRWRWMPWAVAALAVGGALALVQWGPRGEGMPLQGGGAEGYTFTPMTSLPGVEYAGSWSPDGGFLAYLHTIEGSVDLFVLPTAGGEPIPLVRSPCDEGPPRWSPDSKWIAFLGYRDGGWGVQLVSPLGGAVQLLVKVPRPLAFYDDWDPTLGANPWSPDGSFLVFARSREDGGSALWKVELETRTETQMTDPGPGVRDEAGSWSRDGRRLVFNRTLPAGGTPGLWVLELAGAEPKPLLADDGIHLMPAWTPNGDAVLFTTTDRANSDVWRIDLETKRRRRLTVSPTLLGGQVVAPDGRIATSDFRHQTDLYLESADGASRRRLTFHAHDNFEASLSPDGRRIVYRSSRTGNWEIWLLDLDSGQERLLTDNEADDWAPTWTPDGRSVLFLSDRDGWTSPWSVDVEGGRLEPIAADLEAIEGREVAWAQWSPDATWLGLRAAAEGEENALWVVGPDREVTGPLLGGLREFAWYRDGRHVLYLRDGASNEERELRFADLDSAADELLHSGWIEQLAVSADGRVASFVDARSHFDMNLYLLELDPGPGKGSLPRVMGPPRQLTDGQGLWHVHNGSVSADGSHVAYTRDTDSGDIYVLTGALGSDSPAGEGR